VSLRSQRLGVEKGRLTCRESCSILTRAYNQVVAPEITIVGGGLAGSEAAWQLAAQGFRCTLKEMRPAAQTPAHRTGLLAELVCSNSLKSEQPDSAPWLLKEELRRLGSLLLRIAGEVAVPAGQALAVDREQFAARVTCAIESSPLITVRREEVTELPESGSPESGLVIVATGPLTSDVLAASVGRLTGSDRLFFYDAISPIVDAASVDYSKVFPASRHGKGGADDYLNCPLSRGEYDRFYEALATAESHPPHEFEEAKFFEGCLPLEELARRGRDTLRFGPMKPVGLRDPRTGRVPFAAVQLRRETLRADSFNLVGFQNHLRFGEQARVLRLIPGLENALFLRYGQVHRNTYINGPALLDETLALKKRADMFFAGQISGVEGYVESIATGLAAARHVAARARGRQPLPLPRETALGSLCHYIAHADPAHYEPANITFDLLPSIPIEERKARRTAQCRRALDALQTWMNYEL
jgi:methylenetetrahydrofolate--tRNA-(uracil-5-)-methyltransferase